MHANVNRVCKNTTMFLLCQLFKEFLVVPKSYLLIRIDENACFYGVFVNSHINKLQDEDVA